MKIKELVILSILLIAQGVFAQEIDYNKKYANEDGVSLEYKEELTISLRRNKLKIQNKVSESKLYLSNDLDGLINERIPYNTFNVVKRPKAHTVRKRINYYVREFVEKDVLSNGVFFNDQKELRFSYDGVQKGNQTYMEYLVDVKDPHFIPAFILSNRLPIEKAIYTVHFPETVEIGFNTFNLDSSKVEFSMSNEKGINTYTWEIRELDKLNRYRDFSPLHYVPQIIVYIKSYTHGNQQHNVLNDVSDLYNWYCDLTKDINSTNQSELKQIALNLTMDLSTEEEKVKAIYYFVQENINYIAFEDGLNGFIPRDAMNVFTKKYGDCKDMANILNELLHYAGLKSYLTWIGTRNRPYTYEELPTVLTDNHMITAVEVDSEIQFLDATAKYLPYGYPSPFIQGKQALIGKDSNQHILQKVPVVSPEKNRTLIHSMCLVNEGKLIGVHTAKITGYDKLNFNHRYEQKSGNEPGLILHGLSFGNKKTKYAIKEISQLDRSEDSLHISFGTASSNFVKNVGNKMYIQLNMDHSLEGEFVRKKQQGFDKKIDYLYQQDYEYEMMVSPDSEIDHLPENISISNDYIDYTTDYSQKGPIIYLNKTIRLKKLKIPAKDIKEWNETIQQIKKENKKYIILRKI